MSIFFALLGGFLYRWRGSASKYKKYFPRPFNQIVFAYPYAIAAYYFSFWGYELWAAGIVLMITTLTTLTGHGNGMDMGKAPRGEEDETLEFVVKWIHGKIPEYWYDVILMAWLGLTISLPAAIATLNPVIAASGILRSPAYMIGWAMHDNLPKVQKEHSNGEIYYGIKYLPRHFDVATEIGEFLTGLLLWGVLFFVMGQHG